MLTGFEECVGAGKVKFVRLWVRAIWREAMKDGGRHTGDSVDAGGEWSRSLEGPALEDESCSWRTSLLPASPVECGCCRAQGNA